jgi:hypothetical protein
LPGIRLACDESLKLLFATRVYTAGDVLPGMTSGSGKREEFAIAHTLCRTAETTLANLAI